MILVSQEDPNLKPRYHEGVSQRQDSLPSPVHPIHASTITRDSIQEGARVTDSRRIYRPSVNLSENIYHAAFNKIQNIFSCYSTKSPRILDSRYFPLSYYQIRNQVFFFPSKENVLKIKLLVDWILRDLFYLLTKRFYSKPDFREKSGQFLMAYEFQLSFGIGWVIPIKYIEWSVSR